MTNVFLAIAPESICPIDQDILQLTVDSPVWYTKEGIGYKVLNYVSPPKSEEEINLLASLYDWAEVSFGDTPSTQTVSYILNNAEEADSLDILKSLGLSPAISPDP